jgi:hypothetical protein
VSKNIAKALGGDITMSSVKGKGSTFTLAIKDLGKKNGSLPSSKSLLSCNDIEKTSNNNEIESPLNIY